jgi:hypothetical protein
MDSAGPNIALSDVLPSAAAAVGVPHCVDRLGIGLADVVIVCLVDGLGASDIEEYPQLFQALTDASGGSISAAFPTTTSTGLASLGTGLPSGQHGIVGASFLLPEYGRTLNPLHWGSDPPSVSVQPERTVFENIASAGVDSVAIGPAAYARSGLTRAVLRGAQYVQAESISERIDRAASAIADAARRKVPLVAYVYWPALDRAGHEHGVGTAPWLEAAVQVNTLVSGLRSVLPATGRLVVTADHGMVEAGQRIWWEDEPALCWGVRILAGEPRMRHVYVEDDAHEGVRNRWQDVLGERARVFPRVSAISAGLFGPVDPALADRIGDIVVVAQPGYSLASRRIDGSVSALPGQHGGDSDRERRIPGLILAGHQGGS